jgi:hypothetical protein
MRIILISKIFSSYPSSFIDNQFEKFFIEYISSSSFLPVIDNETQLFLMRDKVMRQSTSRQSQVKLSTSKADIDNDQTDDTVDIESKEPTKNAGRKPTNYGDKLFFHYTHEKRFQSFKRDMHQIYEAAFKNTPTMDLKIIVGNLNCRDAQNELIRNQRCQQATLFWPGLVCSNSAWRSERGGLSSFLA